ncbi:P-selectin glycoprotein ligand 1 [Rhynochetos jubatus]
MAPRRAMLVMLVLMTLWACGAVSLTELEPHGTQWDWGTARQVQAAPLPLSRRRREDGGQQPGTTAPGHDLAATTVPESNETESPEPNTLRGSVPPPAPSTNASRHQALPVPTTADPMDETDTPDPDLLSSAPPAAPGTNASRHRALPVPTTADPMDETDTPDRDLLSSAPPAAPSTNASWHQALPVPTTADPMDETESPDPGLLSSAPPAATGTQTAPKKFIPTTPSWMMLPSKEGTAADSTDSNSPVGLHSATPPALSPNTTSSKEGKKSRASPTPPRSSPCDLQPGGTTVSWDPSKVMYKCLLAILLLALVAATFMVCTGVLGALLWRRARTARRRLNHTEMVCISSLLPDGEVATNGPKPVPARRQKLLLDGGSEADGDNLTLSSFLPEHA